MRAARRAALPLLLKRLSLSAGNAADPVDGGFPPRTMPRVSPTLLTPWDPDSPDQSRLSLPFFEHWDRVIRTMGRYNLTAHMMLYVGNKQVQWPPRGSAADDIYWRYVLHRYGATQQPAPLLPSSEVTPS